jgi:muramoyltetrapeptide carboxypeptidase
MRQCLGSGRPLALPSRPFWDKAVPAQTVVRKPPRLRRGDTVGLVEPAGITADAFDLDLVKESITAMDLVPKVGRHVAARYALPRRQGPRERADDINAMYADKDVRAVFAVRGGWGSARGCCLISIGL